MRITIAAGVLLGIGVATSAFANGFEKALQCHSRLEAGAFAEGLKACGEALQSETLSESNLAITANNRGRIYLRLSDFVSAEKDFTKALELDPTYIHALNNRAMARMELGDINGAKSDLNQALSQNPAYPNGLFNRAVLRRALGDLKAALTDLNDLLLVQPDFPKAADERASVLKELGRADSATVTPPKVADRAVKAPKTEAEEKNTPLIDDPIAEANEAETPAEEIAEAPAADATEQAEKAEPENAPQQAEAQPASEPKTAGLELRSFLGALRNGEVDVASVQDRLTALGYETGETSAELTEKTSQAIAKCFEDGCALTRDRELLTGDVKPQTREAKWRSASAVLEAVQSGALDVKALQESLLKLGFNPGEPDGVMGRRTRSALRECFAKGCALK